MKFLIVEDDRNKRLFLESFFKQKGYETYSFRSVQPAINYAVEHSIKLNGIILDLGLSSYDYSDDDYSYTRGLDLIEALDKKGIYIPILINSSVYISNLNQIQENYKELIMKMDDDEWELRRFLNRILEKK